MSDSQSATAREPTQTLQAMLEGYRNTTLVYLAAKLGIPDLLADNSKTSGELAASIGAHPPSLHRILRGLAAIGILTETSEGRFALTAMGQQLRTDAPNSFHSTAIHYGDERMLSWRDLAHSAMTGETAFSHVFGMSNWDYRKQHPESNEFFNVTIRQRTVGLAQAIVAAYDFSPFRTIADIGGGHGALLSAILQAYPSARGILLDQPHVLDGARTFLQSEGVLSRCDLVSGNFFETVVPGADLFILKNIIHDWDDARSLAILKNCHRTLPDHGTLLLVERILPALATQDPDTILADIHMMAQTGGQERTVEEYRALLAEAGFEMRKVLGTGMSVSIVESLRISSEPSAPSQNGSAYSTPYLYKKSGR